MGLLTRLCLQNTCEVVREIIVRFLVGHDGARIVHRLLFRRRLCSRSSVKSGDPLLLAPCRVMSLIFLLEKSGKGGDGRNVATDKQKHVMPLSTYLTHKLMLWTSNFVKHNAESLSALNPSKSIQKMINNSESSPAI